MNEKLKKFAIEITREVPASYSPRTGLREGYITTDCRDVEAEDHLTASLIAVTEFYGQKLLKIRVKEDKA